MTLCIIAFQPEAYESAADALRRIEGYTVTVVPVKGEPFNAAVGSIIVDNDTGQYQVKLHPWDEDLDDADRSPQAVRVLDIYDDITRLEVL